MMRESSTSAESAACPVCGSTGLQALDRYLNDLGIVRGAPYLTLAGCPNCGVLHSHPLPSEQELDDYYRDGDSFYREDPSAELDRVERFRSERAKIHRRQYALLAPLLPAAPPRESGEPLRALDFGCSMGAWLDVLSESGWETYGFEPGPAAVFAARDHAMLEQVPGDLEFDLVILHHVLEHLSDPVSVLRRLRRGMADRSTLYLSVPDFGRLDEHRRLGYVRNEQHIFSFTAAGLAEMLRAGGFAVLRYLHEPGWEHADPDCLGLKLRCLAVRIDVPYPPRGTPLSEAVRVLANYRAGPPADLGAWSSATSTC
jgi:SAM-dependent methyltransferase